MARNGRRYWRPQAINDLVRIARHIAINSPVNADNAIAQLKAQTAALAAYPHLGRTGRSPGTRELVVHNHYIVIYRASALTVEIIRVKHTARPRI